MSSKRFLPFSYSKYESLKICVVCPMYDCVVKKSGAMTKSRDIQANTHLQNQFYKLVTLVMITTALCTRVLLIKEKTK